MNRIVRQLGENFLTTRNKRKDLSTPPSPLTFFGKHASLGSGLVHSRVTSKILKRQRSLMETVSLSASVTKISSKGVLSIL